MRKFVAVTAACLFGMASQASAALTQLSISGTVSGTQSTIACGIGSPISCYTSNPGGTRDQAYSANFLQTILPLDLREGDNVFNYGALSGIGYYSGTINFSNGVLTGRDLTYSYENPGVRTVTVGSSYVRATASTFSVAAITAVPEPGTWALMLLGFGVVGASLRRVPRRTLQAA